MNPQTIELALLLIKSGIKAYESLKMVFDRAQAGGTLTEEEIAGLKAHVQETYNAIQSWKPGD